MQIRFRIPLGSDRSATRLAVEESFDRLFTADRCMARGCDRRPAKRSRFCGCCLEDRRVGQKVVFCGGQTLLPARAEATKLAWGGPATYQWDGVTQ